MKPKIIDIDAEFDTVSFDEHEIKRYTAMKRVNSEKGQTVQAKKSVTMKKKYEDPVFRTNHAEQQWALAQTEEWRSAHADGVKRREANGWYEKRGRAYKPIMTPYGQFESKKAVIEHMTNIGIVNAGGKLSVWLKTKPTEYYYIV